MADERAIERYRRWYRKLLRLYSRAHLERFGEGMEQTFNDLCRERAGAGKGLGGLVFWLFAETLAGILSENGRSFVMNHRSLFRIAIVTGCILIIPLFGDLFAGWHWPPSAFVAWGAVIFSFGLAFDFIVRKGSAAAWSPLAYRAAVGIAIVTAFVLFWMNAAVGIIGDGPINLLYLGVLAVGIIGAYVARFQPRGMSRALFATATAQMLVPMIALLGRAAIDFDPGVGPVLALNAVFAAMWIVSGLLFRYAGNVWQKAPA